MAEDLADVSALEPFSIWSLFVGGPDELARYADGAAILTDDRMTLEFSGPRELHGRERRRERRHARRAGRARRRSADRSAGARRRPARRSGGIVRAMMARRDAHATAYDDYVRALTLDPADAAALDGLVRTAMLTRRGSDALSWVKSLNANRTGDAAGVDCHLEAAGGDRRFVRCRCSRAAGDGASGRCSPRRWSNSRRSSRTPARPPQLDAPVGVAANDCAATVPARHYFAAVAAFLHGQPEPAVEHADAPSRSIQPMLRSTIWSAPRTRSWGRRRRRARRLKPRFASTRTTARPTRTSDCWSWPPATAPPRRATSPRRCGWRQTRRPRGKGSRRRGRG